MKNRPPPLRLISIAWGESYVEDFLELCLPAALAPGNLPVLAERFSVELVFVTESALFEMIKAHPAWKAAANICPVRMIALDDLVATRGSYGMSITYAFFRGFEDLGPAMTDCHMVFLHADFILADGSYRGLLPHLLRGERLAFSPSYCTVSEDVRPLLLAGKNSAGSVLSVSPRQMADMVLRHRHLSIRAKTVNQQFFSVDHIEQYYWAVDENTLLARQFPVALVAMKPEQYLKDLGSYWDYGVIADFCPSMKFLPLGDSDDYLMLELRERDNPKGNLRLGWPSPDAIAKGLLAVITDYTLVLGRARFTLHSEDLPSTVGECQDKLDAFVGTVLEKLPSTLPSHHDHLQWKIHHANFQAARAAYLANPIARVAPVQVDQGAVVEGGATSNPRTVFHRISYFIFGPPGRHRRWHWRYSSSFRAIDIFNECLTAGKRDVLLVHNGSTTFHVPAGKCSIKGAYIASTRKSPVLEQLLRSGQETFDCCLIDVDIRMFLHMREVYALIRPLMRPGGVIVGQFLNSGLSNFGNMDTDFFLRTFPVCGPAKIVYSGNWAAVAAFRLRSGITTLLSEYFRLPEAVCAAGSMLTAAPFALVATILELNKKGRFDSAPTRNLTSVTVKIDVG